MANEMKNTAPQADNTPSIREIFFLFLSKWYWFALSVVICLGIAFAKLITTQPQYSRSMTVLVKETQNRRYSNNSLETVLSQGGIAGLSSKLVNEIEAFNSPDLMRDVVKRLNLELDYSVPARFHDNVIYGTKVPVEISFVDGQSVAANFVLFPSGRDSVRVSKYSYSVPESRRPVVLGDFCCAYGDTVSTPASTFVVNHNPLYQGDPFKEIKVTKRTLEGATRYYFSKLSVAASDVKHLSDVLKLSYTDTSIPRAEDILTMVLNVYNENWVEDSNKMAYSTSLFIKERLANLEKDLGSVDSDISDFKSRNLMPDVKAVSSIYLTQSTELSKTIEMLDNQLYVLNYLRKYLANSIGKDDLIPMSTNLGSGDMSKQISDYNVMLLKRNEMVSNSSESNPLVVDMDSALSSMRNAISVSLDNQINNLEVQRNNLKSKSSENDSKIAANPNQSKYLLSVERQQKVKEALYLFLLQKREENELTQAFTAYNTRVITKPYGLSQPVSPVRSKVFLLAILIGLCIPAGILYVLNFMNQKVLARKDLEGISAPMLGEIPLNCIHSKTIFHPGKKQVCPDRAVVKPGCRNVVNEAFRVLRTNIDFIDEGKQHNVIMVASFLPGSGKSFISLNTSIVFSIKGRKVLLIDADMRKATMSGFFGTPKSGLSDYLAGKYTNVEDVIKKDTGYENLHFLPVGTVPPNPSELLSSARFSEMLEQLKQEYDHIIVDSVPVNMVADARLVGRLVDRTIFVVRSGMFDKAMLPELEELSKSGQYNGFSVLLNAVEGGTSKSYHSYSSYGGYYSSTYYGSDAGNTEEKA